MHKFENSDLKVSFDLKKGVITVIKIATDTSCTFETVLTEYNKVHTINRLYLY